MKKALDFIYTKLEYLKKLNIAKFENTRRLLIASLDVSFRLRKSKIGIGRHRLLTFAQQYLLN
ncbi:MAG: hypothetical protein LBN01_01170 [Endomicrobium sp.]|jgi:hypothetical protein|nr:hypothetical protein [Endomicrobium sp.]